MTAIGTFGFRVIKLVSTMKMSSISRVGSGIERLGIVRDRGADVDL